MTSAREYFEALSQAVRELRDAELVLQFGRPREQGAGGTGPGDPTAREAGERADASARMEAAEEVIGDGLRVIEGVRQTLGEDYGDVLEGRHVDLKAWDALAWDLDLSRTTCRRYHAVALDWCEYKGVAWLREQAIPHFPHQNGTPQC